MKITLFYFSGTGNSLIVAKELKKELKNCELVPIAKKIKNDNYTSNSEKVGFVFPLYYYGLPKIVMDFLNRIEIDNSNYTFAIVTRAGDADGVPLIQLEKVLREKSKNLSAGYFIQMPDNFILNSVPITEDQAKILYEKAIVEIKKIAKDIENSIKNLDLEINEEKLNRIERGNLRFHKNVNKGDTAFFADENCNSCGICEDICPVDNIILFEGKPQWQHKCEQCLACINYCPTQSIQFGKNTKNKKRYHHPEITVKDLIRQKN